MIQKALVGFFRGSCQLQHDHEGNRGNLRPLVTDDNVQTQGYKLC